MSDPRIAIVGAGNHATGSIYPLVGQAGGQIVGVCDLNVELAERNARRWGGTVYTDLEAMLDAETPDGVMICIGPVPHTELAQLVMKRGIPVYTEKPPAVSAAAALKTARLSNELGVLCTTAFKKRYAVCYNRAKEFIDSFPVEDRYSLGVDYCSGEYANLGGSSDYLLDFAIHIIDLVGYLFGEVDEVFAMTKDRHAYAVTLRFASGALASMNLNDGQTWGFPAEEIEITIKGGNVMRVHNSSCWQIVKAGECCEFREPATYLSGNSSGPDTGHLPEIEDFVAAITEGRNTSRSNIYESYKSMVLYDAIEASAASGQVVKVQYEAL
jgi:predicted dehydrogenase